MKTRLPHVAAPTLALVVALATGAAAAERILPVEGGWAPLQVYQVPESSGTDYTDAHCYLFCDPPSGEAMVVDAGVRSGPLALERAASLGVRIALVVSTHFHADHSGGNALMLSRTSARMAAPAREAPLLLGEGLSAADKKEMVCAITPRVDLRVKHGEELKLGAHSIRVIELGGHSPAGIALHMPAQKLLVAGDSLLSGGIARTGIPHATKTHEPLVAAIRQKLLALPDDTKVLPGHGPATTIGAERATNPWLQAPAKAEKAKETPRPGTKKG